MKLLLQRFARSSLLPLAEDQLVNDIEAPRQKLQDRHHVGKIHDRSCLAGLCKAGEQAKLFPRREEHTQRGILGVQREAAEQDGREGCTGQANSGHYRFSYGGIPLYVMM
jgi:hypothetical protein